MGGHQRETGVYTGGLPLHVTGGHVSEVIGARTSPGSLALLLPLPVTLMVISHPSLLPSPGQIEFHPAEYQPCVDIMLGSGQIGR